MEKEVRLKVDDVELSGTLSVPQGAKGFVVFAYGSGSSRFSPRNAFVAKVLQDGGIGTLLIDLLTKKEDEVYETRFNIDLLTERLGGVLRALEKERETKDLRLGLFGASTGAAAALNVAAKLGTSIAAVVSRGGRPDMAIENLGRVVSPTLLIVGGNDFGVIELNESAYTALSCLPAETPAQAGEKKLEVVPGATHLFEEPGALEEVAHLATDWFRKYLRKTTDS